MGQYQTDYELGQTVLVQRPTVHVVKKDCPECEGLGCDKCGSTGQIRETTLEKKYDSGIINEVRITHHKTWNLRIQYVIKVHGQTNSNQWPIVECSRLKPYFKKGNHEV